VRQLARVRVMFTAAVAFNKPRRPFVISVKTDNAGASGSSQFTFPTVAGGSYDFYYKTSEGVSARITTYNDAATTVNFSGGAGTYDIEIHGKFEGFSFLNAGDKLKLKEIKMWGSEFRLGSSQSSHFRGCNQMTISAPDILDISQETYINSTFQDCTLLTTIPRIDEWNFSKILNASSMLRGSSFNQPIVDWNLTSCTVMSSFLDGNTVFNNPISMITPLVQDFSFAFRGMTLFNSSLNIDTGSATTFLRMLDNAQVFNQTLDHLNVENVQFFNGMFWNAWAYNQPMPSWVTSSLTNLTNFVQRAFAFNQDISHFNVSGLTSASNMALSSGFSKINYDKLLNRFNGWPSQSLQNGVNAHFGTAKYTDNPFLVANPKDGRNILKNTYSWTITDGGRA